MAKKSEQKVFYYSDEVNDEFAVFERDKLVIDGDFKYINKNPFWRIAKFFVYRVFMTPFAYIYSKLKLGTKIINKKVVKPFKKQGYFIFGNHTQVLCDAFTPNMVTFPKSAYFVVNADSVSTKGTKNLMMMLGALPLPASAKAMSNFMSTIEARIKQKKCVVIYPEAHIWPYYTDVRPFKSISFKYPCKFNAPSFAITTTYVKSKFRKKPKAVAYVDGPFFADESLPMKERQEILRNQVYDTMKERVKNSTFSYHTYIKVDKKQDEQGEK